MFKNILNSAVTRGLKALSVCLFFANVLLGGHSFAQESTGKDSTVQAKSTADSAKINTTTKTIFSKAKEIASEDKSTIMSIIMIVCVLILVGIALWLSFKSPSSSAKRKKVIERQQQRKQA